MQGRLPAMFGPVCSGEAALVKSWGISQSNSTAVAVGAGLHSRVLLHFRCQLLHF